MKSLPQNTQHFRNREFKNTAETPFTTEFIMELLKIDKEDYRQ